MENINIGINGFGRIGKCIFLQLLTDNKVNIKAININNLSINDIQEYINNDSIHYTVKYKVEIKQDNYIIVNNKKIKVFNEKDPKNLDWKGENINYLFETTGVFLTTEKAKQHNVDYLLMSAPPKDIGTTPIYCYGVNEYCYNKEKIISCASCTTNCIAPMLKLLNKYEIENGNFITVHSATSSQSVVDTANFKKRTNRSIFNNIIPHTTGASQSLDVILPELKNKIIGTSVRVPVSNVSMIDLNVQFKNPIKKEIIINDIEKIKDEVITTNNKKLVSSDFIGDKTPTIVDTNSTIQLTEKSIKFSLWYDNEWSYSAQMIRLMKHMFEINNNSSINKIQNVDCKDKSVFVRVDYNCPTNDNNEITDDFRIKSAMKTITKILLDKPKRLIIATHFGRPKNKENKYSTQLFIPHLEKFLKKKIFFLEKGLDTSQEEIENIEKSLQEENKIYLMENVRFHVYETKDLSQKNINLDIDIYCNEAFSCSHRNHKSITEIPNKIKCYGYCFTKEIQSLDIITKSQGCNILAVVGGSKMEDKIMMLRELSKKISYIYITGNNINSKENYKEFFNEIEKNKAKIIFTEDGFMKTNGEIEYCKEITNDKKICDIGPKSLNTLNNYINKSEIIFWNGTLGITEDNFFKNGSENLLNTLNNSKAKVIIGGGDTAGFVNKYENNFCHISTGGGASIDYIAKGNLIGLQ